MRSKLVTGGLVGALVALGTAGSSAGVPGSFAGVVAIRVDLGLENATDAGAGMVLSGSGEVLTNNHLIRGATSIRVTDIDNGHTYSATVVGYDLSADVAVLRLQDASGLQPVALGDSATAKVGEPVTLIVPASSVGAAPSTVTGTITALDQSITASEPQSGASEQLTGMIETDASLGTDTRDSGGPMLNGARHVLGMVTASSNGFADAIPINMAIAVAREIEAGRSSQEVHVGATPFLGVEVSGEGRLGVLPARVVVAGVLPGSPVQKAGLKAGDQLASLDGQKITSPSVLADLLITKHPGDTVRLGWVDQAGTAHSSSVRLASGPPQ